MLPAQSVTSQVLITAPSPTHVGIAPAVYVTVKISPQLSVAVKAGSVGKSLAQATVISDGKALSTGASVSIIVTV